MTVMAIPLFYPIFLFLPNIFLNFFITFTPNTIPSKTAIPVLNALIMAFALLVAGSSGAQNFLCKPSHDFFLESYFL